MYLKKIKDMNFLCKNKDYDKANKLANKYIKENKTINAFKVNKALKFHNIKVKQDFLDKVLSKPILKFDNLDVNIIKSDLFLEKLGRIRSKAVPGVYIWIHKSTNYMYVGSSNRLARRLIGYIKMTYNNIGKLIPLIKKDGLNSFSLQVIPLTNDYKINQELALEQYFLLHSCFNLNTIKIVKSVSNNNKKSLYMYTKDLSTLIFFSDTQEDFVYKLNIHYNTFTKSIKTGYIYLNKYVFKDKFIKGAKYNNMSIKDINIMLNKDRLKEKEKLSKTIELIPLKNNEEIKYFKNTKDCVNFLNKKGPSSKSTLYRHILLGKPYYGYICRSKSNKGNPLIMKSISVSITDIYTKNKIIYPSLRKAAKSFLPEYKTTESTIKTYATNGKIFINKYIINFNYS